MNFVLANRHAPEANGIAPFIVHFMKEWATFNGQTSCKASISVRNFAAADSQA